MTQKRILVRGVNWLGDAVMTMPALCRLREAYPDAHIALLTPEKLADLWRAHPAVDDVLTLVPGESRWEVAQRIRAGQFDTGLLFPTSLRSALELWLAGVPTRIGYGGQGRTLLLTRASPLPPGVCRTHKYSTSEVRRALRSSALERMPDARHHIHRYLGLTAALGASPEPLAPQIDVPAEDAQAMAARLGLTARDGDRPLFGLNPGAGHGPAKRWPPERFIAAASELQRRTDCRWVIFGGSDEREQAGRIAAAIQENGDRHCPERRGSPVVWNMAGETSLPELCAALHLCRLLLTNDTGPMHVAAAVGTPVVAIFGSTSPTQTCPGLPGDPRHILLSAPTACAPCFRRECPIDFRCMTAVTVPQVVHAVQALFQRQHASLEFLSPSRANC
ncbi:MAG: lipopolysaccharide heptosyltransferase II [Armatimonadota bacterium]|nr:lipopolysaccharide heptosyltransferase II [Armatimonadota bacterium]